MRTIRHLTLASAFGVAVGLASAAIANVDPNEPSASHDLCDDVCGNCPTGVDNCACNAGGKCVETAGGG